MSNRFQECPHTDRRTRCGAMRALVSLFFLLVAQVAHAQSSSDKIAAEQLFNEARRLMEQSDYDAACPKLLASLELDRAAGTAINLALCYEKTGKLASAWMRYRQAEDLDKLAGNKERQEFARASAEALENRLPRLMIRVPSANEVPGLKVTRNGEKIARPLIGASVFVNPGLHRIFAVAPGYRSFSITIEALESEKSVVEIPMLKPEHGIGPKDEGAGAMVTKGAEMNRPDTRSAYLFRGKRQMLGVLMATGGLASIATGLGFGWAAISTWNRAFADGLCSAETWQCTLKGQDMTDIARTRSTVSSVLVGTGIALTGAGIALYLTATRRRESRTLTIVPVADGGTLGMTVSAHF